MKHQTRRRAPGRAGVTNTDPDTLAPLPVYSAQTIASVHSGIPITVFRASKAAGCPAFVSNKVSLGPFLKWYFNQNTNGESHRERKERADADLAEIRVAEARRNLVSVERVEKWAEAIFTALRQGVLSSSLTENEKDELLTNLQKLTDDTIGGEGDVDFDSPADTAVEPSATDDSV